MSKVELLAPAGNSEAFYGAINAGADAVYLAGKKFGARAYADNFSEDEIICAVKYAHLFGRKVYLTVNTLTKSKELEEIPDYIRPLYVAGLDGVIVQDIGVMQVLKDFFPDLEVHASTQCTITGAYSANILKELGVTRVVPARELSLKELVNIKRETGLEIETFIHGAMCYCYSGQCLFSSVLGGRSGNRGRCAGPCRLPYTSDSNKKPHYLLSLKDMCTLDILQEILESGVDSLKIEGRMKKPEYSAGVTALYRKYIDLYEKNGFIKVDPKDYDFLRGLYIRQEIQNGYYKKYNGRDMVTLDSPAYNGAEEENLKLIRSKYLSGPAKKQVTITGTFFVGAEPVLQMQCGELTVEIVGEKLLERAQKAPMTEEKLAEKLGRLGDTFFEATKTDIYTDNEVFISVGELNALKRQCVDKLMETLCPDRSVVPFVSAQKKRENPDFCQGIAISIETDRQLSALMGFLKNNSSVFGKRVKRIYVPLELLEKTVGAEGVDIYLSTPRIIRLKDRAYMESFLSELDNPRVRGILVRSLEMLGYLKQQNYRGNIITDENLYVFNERTTEVFGEFGIYGVTLPTELNNGELKNLAVNSGGVNLERTFYGYIPLMVASNCVWKTEKGCKKERNIPEEKVFTLTDRNRVNFRIATDCKRCLNTLYNSVPTFIEPDKYGIRNADIRINFTIENEEETLKILKKEIPENHTGGHNLRGVE